MKSKIIFLSFFFIFATLSLVAQIPDGYYNSANVLSGESLKSALHNIIKNHTEFPYTSSSTDTWDILKESDRDTANSENVILFYSGWSVNAEQEYNDNTGWSREHVWAKSHGDFGTDLGAGTDVHHLRPTDITVNSARSNLDFDIGGILYVDGDGETECRKDGDSWEPRDKVKGDVARMLFYMATRYEGENGEPDLELVDDVNTFDLNEPDKGFHGKLSVLLQWHEADTVDSFERNRNEIIYGYQKNRNPFIDHPEFVKQIWGTETGTSNLLKSYGIQIYPNPAREEINFKLPNNVSGQLSIFNICAELVFFREITGDFKLESDILNSGVYLIKFVSSKGEIHNFKLIISK